MCGQEFTPGANHLKGICQKCDKQLGGGKHSAKIVKQEFKKMEQSWE